MVFRYACGTTDWDRPECENWYISSPANTCLRLSLQVGCGVFATMQDVYLALDFLPEDPDTDTQPTVWPPCAYVLAGPAHEMLGADRENALGRATHALCRVDAWCMMSNWRIPLNGVRQPSPPGANGYCSGAGEFWPRRSLKRWSMNSPARTNHLIDRTTSVREVSSTPLRTQSPYWRRSCGNDRPAKVGGSL